MTVEYRERTTILQQHITGTSVGNAEATVSIGTAQGGRCVCINSPAAVLSNVNGSAAPGDPQVTTTVNDGICGTAAAGDILVTTTVKGGICGTAATGNILVSTTVNSGICGLMTVEYRERTTILQQHITGTSVGDTEAAVNVGPTQSGRSVCRNSPAAVLSNVNGSAAPGDGQVTTAVNRGARGAATTVYRQASRVNGSTRCTGAAPYKLVTTTVNGGTCDAATYHIQASTVNGYTRGTATVHIIISTVNGDIRGTATVVHIISTVNGDIRDVAIDAQIPAIVGDIRGTAATGNILASTTVNSGICGTAATGDILVSTTVNSGTRGTTATGNILVSTTVDGGICRRITGIQ